VLERVEPDEPAELLVEASEARALRRLLAGPR
jgi:hypothetical protein